MLNSLKRLSTASAPASRDAGPRVALAAWMIGVALLVACGSGDSDVRIRAIAAADPATPDAATSPDPDASAESTSEPDPIELPFAPENRVGGGLLVAEYLAGGLADLERCLPELVRDWELEPVAGERCAVGDIDGDGLDELIYAVGVPGDPAPPGDVWFFDDAGAGYRLFTSARALANEILAGVNIEALVDLTGDGAPEAVISTQTCDGERCTTSFVIASAHRGFSVEDLTPDDLTVSSTEGLVFEDGSDDQLTDLLIRREPDDDDPAAGPERASTLTVTWSGLRFRVDEEPDPPEYLIHLVVDADEAYRTGDLELAADLYLQAAADISLRDWKAESGQRASRAELQPYSLFRAALAAQRQGDPETALQLLGRAFGEHQDSLHGLAAGIYLQALENGNAASTACTASESYLGRLASVHVDVWDYGFSIPEHEITALCR